MSARDPVYVDEAVALYHGNALEVLRELVERTPPVTAALVLTDPPFSEHTHKNAKRDAGGRTYRNRGGDGAVPEDLDPKRIITFASWTARDVGKLLRASSHLKAKWFVANVDWEHAAEIRRRERLRGGWSFIRLGVWVKDNPAPSFTGDRPGMGWEGIMFLHNPGRGALQWNGGGDCAVYRGPRVDKARWPSEKPEWLGRALVEQFTEPGDLVVDPCMGSGSFVRAAKDLGRRAIGIDVDADAVAIAVERMRPPAHPRFNFVSEPITEQPPLLETPKVKREEKKT